MSKNIMEINSLKIALRNPKKLITHSKKKVGRLRNSIHGVNILNEDWDNLIILDACRYDIFDELNYIPGDLEIKFSNASSSDEFMEKNLDNKAHGDLVYICANPHIDNIRASFHEIIRLWETDWNESKGTVMPSDVVIRVRDNIDKFPNKRIIIHMMQPHRPFVGPKSNNFEMSGFSRQGVNIPYGSSPEVPFWWDRLRSGEIERELVWSMYKDSLDYTLPYIEDLLNLLPGKSVISADHGNCFGENNIYGHPSYTHHPNLLKIPWLTVDKERKDIIWEPPYAKSQRTHYIQAQDNLKSLGYIQ